MSPLSGRRLRQGTNRGQVRRSVLNGQQILLTGSTKLREGMESLAQTPGNFLQSQDYPRALPQ